MFLGGFWFFEKVTVWEDLGRIKVLGYILIDAV